VNKNSVKEIGRTGVRIPALCFGTSSLGNMPETYTYEVDEVRAIDTVKTILNSELPFLDCSRNYGMGRSEERIGMAIRELGGLPEQAIVSTKLDRDMDTLVLDASRARRSLEESLEALGISHIDILHLHDPEPAESVSAITRPGGALDELFKMRDEGICKVVGLAAGDIDVMLPILREREFDIVITHNRHTLVNANAEPLIEHCHQNNIAVMNAAPYCGGALAKGTADFSRYVYQEATDAVMAPLRAVEEICKKYDIPPGAAALQYSVNDHRIHSTICGVSKPDRIQQTLDWANFPIPDAAWSELNELPRESSDPEASRVYNPG